MVDVPDFCDCGKSFGHDLNPADPCRLKIGSLFSGYGGLDMAVEAIFDARTVWHVEVDPHASKVLAERWDAPNLGDITKITWEDIEPIDVLCGGFPCQDISTAGFGAGIKEGTRSGLWFRFADAVRVLRPRLVVVENVRALLVRGIDIVAGDLASIGYDCRWCCLRASDIGAPHRRERVFMVAWPAGTNPDGLRPWRRDVDLIGTDAAGDLILPTPTARDSDKGHDAPGREGAPSLTVQIKTLPTPTAAADSGGYTVDADGEHVPYPGARHPGMTIADAARIIDDTADVELLPTPVVNDMGEGKTIDWWEAWLEDMKAGRVKGGQPIPAHGKSLHIEAQRMLPTPLASTMEYRTEAGVAERVETGFLDLYTVVQTEGLGPVLPTPTAADGIAERSTYAGGNPTLQGAVGGTTDNDRARHAVAGRVVKPQIAWGAYAPAIARWETVIGRPAPSPTDDANGRLNPLFVEWMMGLPEGWVCGILERRRALKALGNGVCPQQAAAGLVMLIDDEP